jgi:hypothetical protein
MCSISCFEEVSATFELFPHKSDCDLSNLIRLVEFAFEAVERAVASQVSTPGLSHIPTGTSRREVRGFKHSAMKIHGGVVAEIHTLLSLKVTDQLHSPGRFKLGEIAPVPIG